MNQEISNGVKVEQRQYRRVRWTVVLASTVGLGVLLWASVLQSAQLLPYLSGESLDCGCQILNLQLSPLATGLALGLIGLTGSMFVRGLWRFGRRAWSDRRLVRMVGNSGRTIQHHPTDLTYWLVTDVSRRAMTIGLFAPRVVVTSGLLAHLSKSELSSVLRHEQAHQQSHDPIWSAVIEALGAAWWWLPTLKSWVAATYRLRELAADEAALESADRQSLGSAVLKLLQSEPGPTAAFSPNGDRVEKILNPAWRPRLDLWSWPAVLSLGLVMLGFGLLVRWTETTAATVPTLPAQVCQEVRLACSQPQPTSSSASVLCVSQGGLRCVWVLGPAMSSHEPFSQY